MGVDVRLSVGLLLARSPSLSVAIFAAAWAHLRSGFSSSGRNWGLAAPMFLGIVGELVFGRIAEIEVTGDNRHIEVRE